METVARNGVSPGRGPPLMSCSRRIKPFRGGHTHTFFIPLILIWMLLILGERGTDATPFDEGPNYIPEEMIPPLTSAFMKLIPQFNPNAFTVQFKTDARIALSPTNPSLVPFLLQYQAIAMNEIGQSSSDDVILRNGMTTYFNSEYGRFVSEVGLPVGCVSFYAGATDLATIRQLESLSKTLNSGDASNNGNGRSSGLFDGIGGSDLVHRLNLDRITGPFREAGLKIPPAICGKIFWILKDGTVVANLPSTDFSSRRVWVPTTAVAINIYNANVTQELSQYFATGVSCLNDVITKRNFSSTVTKWMSSKLIPQILQSPRCIPGFPKILQLLISIEMYKHTLVYVQQRQRQRVAHAAPPPLPPPVYYDDGDYYNRPIHGDQYIGPLQPVRQAGDEHVGVSHAGFSSTLLTVLIVFFILFAFCCCCCCLIPLCCPDLKTCARMQKIFVRAKRSLDRLKTQKTPSPDYKPIFEDEDDDEEDEEAEKPPRRKKKRSRPVRQCRKKRVCEKKCRPKIEIPICSDTSISICVTTEEDCCPSSSDDQQIGYISKELDSAFCRQNSEEDDTSPVETIQKKKPQGHCKQRKEDDCPFEPPQKQLVKKPYRFTWKHEKRYDSPSSTDNVGDDIEDRYQDAARRQKPKQQPRNDGKKGKSDNALNWPPQSHEEVAAAAHMKSKYYDKLVTDWKYNRKEGGGGAEQGTTEDEDNLGEPPPPRNKNHKGGRINSIPF